MLDFEKVQRLLGKFKNYTIYAGFSGGADSTALLLLLKKLAPLLKFNLQAVHFQHNIRGAESLKDAEWCREFCENRNIPFLEIELNVLKNTLHGEGIEAAARRLRLASWETILSDRKKVLAALGHHGDDRVENMFIRAFRGSNSSGLTSMRAVHKIGKVTYIRPLLSYRRIEIENFLKAENISDWRVDSTNADTVYRRNFLRKSILPEIYRHVDFSEAGLQQSVSVLEDDADFLEKAAAAEFKKLKNKEKTPIKFWIPLHPALRIRVLRLWLTDQLERDFIPDRNLMERLEEELNSYKQVSGEKILIPLERNLYMKLQKGKCSIFRYNSDDDIIRPDYLEWNWKEMPLVKWQGKTFTAVCMKAVKAGTYSALPDNQACFEAASVPEKFIIRLSENGDRMQPFGSEKEVRLKKLFSGRKILSDDKMNYPLLTTPDNKIIWMPCVRHSSFAPVTKQTKSILIIKCVY